MKTVILSIVSVLAAVTILHKGAHAKEWSWDTLKDIKKVEGFQGQAWFCQAKTFTGYTECYNGAKPQKPGCYVLLNPEGTAWISPESAAAQLGADFHSPGHKKHISSALGYGCDTPTSDAYWLLWEVK